MGDTPTFQRVAEEKTGKDENPKVRPDEGSKEADKTNEGRKGNHPHRKKDTTPWFPERGGEQEEPTQVLKGQSPIRNHGEP